MFILSVWLPLVLVSLISVAARSASQKEDDGCDTVDDSVLLQTRMATRPSGSPLLDVRSASSFAGLVFLARPRLDGDEGTLTVIDERGGLRPFLARADPKGIAVDASAQKIYWCQPALGSIMRANLDGTDAEEIISGLANPQRLALDLPRRQLYWNEWLSSDGSEGTLLRADLDSLKTHVVIPAPSFSFTSFIGISSPQRRNEERPIEFTLDACTGMVPALVTDLALSPDPAVLGGTTRFSFSVSLGEGVEVGNYTINIMGPAGFVWATHTAELCGESSSSIEILSIYVGKIALHGPPCPISSEVVAVDLDLELVDIGLTSALEASVVMSVEDLNKEELMCSTFHLAVPAVVQPVDAYWLTTHGELLRRRVDGSGDTQTLLSLSNMSFGGFALDDDRSRLYLAEHGEGPESQSDIVAYDYSSSHGLTNRNVLVRAVPRVTSIDVDGAANVLYWADNRPAGAVSRLSLDRQSDIEVFAHVAGTSGSCGLAATRRL